MSEELPSGSRASRRNSQKSTSQQKSKLKRLLLPISATVLLATGVSLVLTQLNPTIALSSTPDTASKVYFQDATVPAGWKINPSVSLEGQGDLTAAQNPAQIFSEDGKCSYTRQVFHMPSYQSGRTDDFLSRQYVYQVAESNESPAQDTSVITVPADKGQLELFTATYTGKAGSDLKTENGKAPESVYRSTAVRVIDKTVKIEGVPMSEGLFGTDASSGLPVISLSYECIDESSWDEGTWKSLVASTRVSLFSEDVPARIKPSTPAPSNSSSTGSIPTTEPAPAEVPPEEPVDPPADVPPPADPAAENNQLDAPEE